VETEIVQATRVFHTRANPMERLLLRPQFDGPVTPGTAYALVDDVTCLGGTLAELADYIQAAGGKVAAPLCHQRSPLGLSDPPGGPTDHHETDLRRKRSRRCPPADEPAEPRERA
jgi:hypothetical protein